VVVRIRAVLLSSIVSMALTRPIFAQCTSNASSCVTCHETRGLRPVLQSAQLWHVDHGFDQAAVVVLTLNARVERKNT
jgi:hypothetical protein